MTLDTAYRLALAVAVLAALALVLLEPERCRTTRGAYRVLTTSTRWTCNLLLLLWVLASWRRATRNLGLAYADKHAIKRERKWDAKKGVTVERERPRITYPWLIAWPDAYGVVAMVWTRVGVGRSQWEDAAEYLADTWRCRRVQVEQKRPGRITVRGLRRDPLDARLSFTIPAMSDQEQEGDDDEHNSPPRAA